MSSEQTKYQNDNEQVEQTIDSVAINAEEKFCRNADGIEYALVNSDEIFEKSDFISLIEANMGFVIAEHPDRFSGLSYQEVATILIEKGYGGHVADNIDKFIGLDNTEMAIILIEKGYISDVAYSLGKFHGLDKRSAMIFIEKGYGRAVDNNLDSFNELNKEIFMSLIKGGYLGVVINLEKFTGLDKEAAIVLIEKDHIFALAKNLGIFTGLDKEVATILIKNGEFISVCNNLGRFTGLDKEIAIMLMTNGNYLTVIENSDALGIDSREIVMLLVSKKDGRQIILKYLDKLTGIDHQEIAMIFMDNEGCLDVVDNLDKFTGLNHKEIIMRILRGGDGLVVVEYPDKFSKLNLQEIAMILIENGYGFSVANKLENFPGLNFDQICTKTSDLNSLALFAEKMNIKIKSELANNSALPYYSERYAIQTNESEAVDESGQLDYEKVFQIINELYIWDNEQTVAGPMQRGAEIFGYEKMFNYINRNDTSRHDQLFFFDSVIKMFNTYKSMHGFDESMSEQKMANMFFSNILQQVKMDNSESSYARLAAISQNTDFSPEAFSKYSEQITSLKQDGFVEEMERMESLVNGECFESWKNLNNFAELLDMLNRSEIWKKLAVLKQKANTSERSAAMYDYVSTIMFHRDSSVNVSAAEEFFLNPNAFLKRDDQHAPNQLHNRKKPSNYFDIPNLDLTGIQLVEALATGEIDTIQTFPGMEIIYVVTDPKDKTKALFIEVKTSEDNLSLIDQVKLEIGSRKLGNANPKLFGELSKLLKTHEIKLNPTNIDEIDGHLTPEISHQVEELLASYPNHINADRSNIKNVENGKKYRVKIYDKHDPRAALAGDDTNCCMPFGSGKNNVYTFNPNCGLLTVEIAKADGGYTTIAQSVLTLDQNIGSNVSELVSKLNINGADDALSRIDIVSGDNYIACDNIEIRTNYQTDQNRETIAKLYQNFFARYAKVFNQNNLTGRTVNTDKIVVGQGYSDYHFGNQEENTYVPLAPASYSDKLGKKVDVIKLANSDKIIGVEAISEKITTSEQFAYNEGLPNSVKPLTYQDALMVAHLESKAYNNKSLIEGLSAMENSLIAVAINNASKNRPNLSFKYGNSGYLLAYEGEIGDLGGEKGIYIEDLAADPTSPLAGGTLMLTLLDQYKKNYVEKGNLLPIYGQMRESTSYQLVQKNIGRFAERLGIKLELQELGSYSVNGDTMHKVVIRPVIS